ncbi:MAG: hypothetical protein FD143_3034 [Ignavibacteria bacterium]|nr:MAG: hypothetical protein FD143_3034 [Ignavibacteria bacterium]
MHTDVAKRAEEAPKKKSHKRKQPAVDAQASEDIGLCQSSQEAAFKEVASGITDGELAELDTDE